MRPWDNAPMSTISQTERADASPLPRPLDGLSAIADRYDTFIVDLWGVIHNGIAPFPGVQETLAELQAAGKKVCLLTNAPRRSIGNVERLEGMGIPRTGYTVLVSSGEATHFILRDRPEPFHQSLGRRCFHYGPVRDCDVHHGLDLEMVSAPEAASFVLCTGIDQFSETLEDHRPMLQRIAALGLPMLCANPDIIVIVGDKPAICAGTLAKAFAEMGGTVGYIGKPHGLVYEFALKETGHTPGTPVLCIGDGFHTDISGAAAAGFDSVFICSGIHAEELDGGSPASGAMAGLIERYGVAPQFVMRSLAW